MLVLIFDFHYLPIVDLYVLDRCRMYFYTLVQVDWVIGKQNHYDIFFPFDSIELFSVMFVVLFVVEMNNEDFQSIHFDGRALSVIDVVANCDDYGEILSDRLIREEDRMNQLYVFQYPIDKYLDGNEIIGNVYFLFASYQNDH